MLIWTARFSRKKAVISVIIFGVIMVILILLTGRTPSEKNISPVLTENSQRTAYLQSLGWNVEPEPLETLQFLFPDTLEEPYLSYNELQLTQGFDLAACCGKQVTRYTYAVTNYPDYTEGVQANLYVCEEVLAAGDICYLGKNGFQKPLISIDTLQNSV